MLLTDTLTVIGLAIVSLGSIHEADGPQERTFWLRNDGTEAVVLRQGYTSCGCTTIDFAQGCSIAPGDSSRVALRFNPRGRGGDFYESGIVVYGEERKHVEMALQGTCTTSEETLLRQFPHRVSNELRLSAIEFDLGYMKPGEAKERTVVVLHRDEEDRRESVTLSLTADRELGTGVQHIVRTVVTQSKGRKVEIPITLHVIIK